MKNAIVHAGLAALVAVAALMVGGGSAEAAVYCKYVGYPKGCVVRPGVVLAPRPVVVAPPRVVYCTYVDYPVGCVVRPGVVLRPAVYCTHIGYPRGCVARAGVVLRPAPRGVNLGGPVNRRGVR